MLFPVLLAPAQLLLFGPFTTYSRNETEFAVGFWSLAPSWLPVAAGLSALLVAAGVWLLPRRALRSYVAVLFAVGLLLWVQGNLLVPDLGPLYGAPPDFESVAWRTPYELGVWAAVLVLAVVFARRLSGVAPVASQALLALQLVVLLAGTTGLLGRSRDEGAPEVKRWSEPPARLFELSRQTNVIHLVLDGFASEIFAEAMQRDRAAFDRAFPGFVYFEDHLGAFRTTRASMPAMMTGVAYRNEVPFDDFSDRVWQERSIFRVLADHGYQIHSATFHTGEQPPASSRPVRYDLPTPYADRETYERFVSAQVLDLTLFRHAPTALKRRIYNEGRWVLQQVTGLAKRQVRHSSHLLFLDHFTSRLTVALDEPVYLFMHVLPPHPPVVLDASCAPLDGQRFTWASYSGQGACVLTYVQRLLDRLRALGVYDRSAILLTADHGFSPRRRHHPLEDVITPAGRLYQIATAAAPLLAVKPPGAEGPLRTSQAPTSITDLPATIATLAGVPAASLPGRSIFEIDAGAARPRTFTFHSWNNADWKRPYFDVLLLFDVNGRVLDAASWSFKQAILDPTNPSDDATQRLEFGLSGVRRENGEAFRWGARYAVTYLPASARTLRVTARKDAATTSRAAVTVRLDGRVAGRLELKRDGWHTWTHRLEPRKSGHLPFCVELLSERDGNRPGVRAGRIQYGPSFWND